MTGTLRERVAAARQALAAAGIGSDTAALDADVLACHVLGWDRAQLLARGPEPEPEGFADAFLNLIARRARREPVALITGRKEFWGLDFHVTSATLIPRPETEFIVEEALGWLPHGARSTVLDIGTGSGCLAVSIARERPGTTVVATDISDAALAVARRNAATHGVLAQVRFVRTDLAAGLDVRADVIVSNPPYVPDRAAPGLSPEISLYEPPVALFGGDDGLGTLRRLFAEAPCRLAQGGAFIVEFGDGQEDPVRAAASEAGWRVERVICDLQEIPRTIVLRR